MSFKQFMFFGVLLNVCLILSPMVTSTTVDDQTQLEEVTFGFPFAFVKQNQTSLTPPMPYEATLLSANEHPTSLLFGYLFLSFILMNSAYLFLALWSWRRGGR
ncbi:hypothetical protein [Mangrovibacillus cuniculi]|uniref:DUF4306 domain-containing protein n=1 Tax=Mangrovibacillus cuniculi TaxID=2593652 RepID=A0A7S8C9J5_9BACI|nr:hypothetical protein [Mangrovibacillus cuniculi]QPC45915.1 hypothetical protein G8O30_02555 [Mangrovibacillus cuniculi]